MRRRETTGGWRRRSCRFLVLMGLVTILLSPERAGADEVELFLRGAWIEVTSEDAIRFDRSGQRLPVRFRGSFGPTVGIDIPLWGNFRGELTVSWAEGALEARRVRADGSLGPFSEAMRLELIPVTGAARYHLFPGGRVDPYGGAGISATVATRKESGRIFIDTDSLDKWGLGVFGSLGSNISLAPRFPRLSLTVDAKYVMESRRMRGMRSLFGLYDQDIDFNQLIAGAGLRVRF